ncbi:hypothetical protein JCM8547_005669 [Rhodosporidiobolus lusitaniae]
MLELPHFTKYLDDYGVSMRREAADLIRGGVSHDLTFLLKERAIELAPQQWHAMTVSKKEDIFLTVLERLQRRAETRHQMFDEEEDVSYRHIPNKAWERLNDATQAKTPVSRGMRAFSEEGRIMRALFFVQFSVYLIRAINKAVPRCAECLKQETEDKKLLMCPKCKAVGRAVRYCSRECQVQNWKAGNHNATYGKCLSELNEPRAAPRASSQP